MAKIAFTFTRVALDIPVILSINIKGRRVVNPSPLVTFPVLSVDKFADQFQNCNQRIRTRDYSPQNDD